MINVTFVDAAKEGGCNACTIRHYTVAKIMLGTLEVRLCECCAGVIVRRLGEEPHFLRTVKVTSR